MQFVEEAHTIYAARPEARAGWTAVCAPGGTISFAALAVWIATTPQSAWKGLEVNA